ncbi:MAG TPA: hypothetical protein VNS46_17830 [Nocardioides sp.]|nr:hypothetical protein [Nocardioides sp.]
MDDLGLLRRVDPAAVDDDPFWSVVRRRHPGADLVLLPPGEPGDGEPAAGLADDALRSAVRALADAWRVLAPLAVAAGGDDPPTYAWRRRPRGHALVAQKALRGIGAEAGVALLRSVGGTLGGDGWLLRPARRGDVVVLDARGGLVDLRAEAGAGATVLTLATRVLPVGAADRSRVLEQVRSWQ